MGSCDLLTGLRSLCIDFKHLDAFSIFSSGGYFVRSYISKVCLSGRSHRRQDQELFLFLGKSQPIRAAAFDILYLILVPSKTRSFNSNILLPLRRDGFEAHIHHHKAHTVQQSTHPHSPMPLPYLDFPRGKRLSRCRKSCPHFPPA